MEEQMELVLQRDLDDLIPAMIAWNNEELLAKVRSKLSAYENAVYDDSNISKAKEDKARLNKFADALNQERLAIKKRYVMPLDKFTAEVNDVIAEVKAVSARIDAVVSDYEAKKRMEKKEALRAHYSNIIGNLSEQVTYEKIEDVRWYNASTSLKSAKSDIEKKVEDIRNDIVAIEALHSDDEVVIKAYYFRTLSLPGALRENQRLKEERLRIEEYNARKAAAMQESIPANPVQNSSQPEQQETTVKTYTVRFCVETTAEKLRALKSFLKENEIEYKAI